MAITIAELRAHFQLIDLILEMRIRESIAIWEKAIKCIETECEIDAWVESTRTSAPLYRVYALRSSLFC